MEICDIINHTEDGPEDAVKAIKRRFDKRKLVLMMLIILSGYTSLWERTVKLHFSP